MQQHFSVGLCHGLVLPSKPQLEHDCMNKQLFDEREVGAMGCLWKVRQTCATDPFSFFPFESFWARHGAA